METIVKELAGIIEKRALTPSEAAAHIGCSPKDLCKWMRGETEPSAFFLGVLPGVVEDLSRLYPEAAERKG